MSTSIPTYSIPIIETERLILKPISIKFCSNEYVNWLNDPEIYQYLDNGGNYTFESLYEYLTKYTESPVYFWAIIIKNSYTHIGNIKIDPISLRNQIGEYGILMGDKNSWGKGYAKEASQVVIKFCFQTLGLRKIALGVIQDNVAAVKLYESLGFEVEGIYRMHGIYAGKYCDAIRMALFNMNDPDVQNYLVSKS
jgi:[ribosomal protein S5]-alanine N-acetyltransferase